MADMVKTQTKDTVKSDKHQSNILIGVALIIVGLIILYISLSQPRISSKSNSSYIASSVTDNLEQNESVINNSSEIIKDENVVVNINTCTPEDLMQIHGIGESKANAIVAYREYIGGYSSTEEVKNISGFSDKFYDSIKDNITV